MKLLVPCHVEGVAAKYVTSYHLILLIAEVYFELHFFNSTQFVGI